MNPFQKLFAGLAKDTNFQIVEENGARVVNDVEVAKFLRVKAIARSSAASDVRTNVTIGTVDINLFGKKVKTITLEPSPGKGIGYVEQLYLDDKVRVSVGNKGSIQTTTKMTKMIPRTTKRKSARWRSCKTTMSINPFGVVQYLCVIYYSVHDDDVKVQLVFSFNRALSDRR